MHFTFEPIATAHTCYPEKFGIPRQPGLVPSAWGELRMLPPFNRHDAVRELTQCSHLWVQFVFHQNKCQQWRPKVRPPRLGGNDSIGVFATRSPYRPNPIGLSVVRLLEVVVQGDAVTLKVEGVDFLDGTPVLDIKPYVPYTDAIPSAVNHIAPHAPETYDVEFDPKALLTLAKESECLIRQTLSQDPRPQYHALDPKRVYKARIDVFEVQWRYQSSESSLVIHVMACERVAE